MNVCALGCGGAAQDSIEHYRHCRVLRQSHREELELDQEDLLQGWLGLRGQQSMDDVQLCRGALGCYAAYRITNAARHGGGFPPEEAHRAFRQALVEATTGGDALAWRLRERLPERHAPPLKRPRMTIREALARM